MSLLSKHEKLKIKRKEYFKAKFCKNQNLAFNLDKKRLSNMIDCSICLVVYSKNTLLIYVLKIGTLFTGVSFICPLLPHLLKTNVNLYFC